MNLNLVLHKEWFDKPLDDKADEYRAITAYWCNKLLLYKGDIRKKEFWEQMKSRHDTLLEGLILNQNKITGRRYDDVVFSNGMKPVEVLPRFSKKYVSLSIGFGREDWGAPKDDQVFIIQCGVVKNKRNC